MMHAIYLVLCHERRKRVLSGKMTSLAFAQADCIDESLEEKRKEFTIACQP